MLEAILILLLLVAVIVIVGSPLVLNGHLKSSNKTKESIVELEAVKEAKISEIRDSQLDFKVGKLNEENYHALDRELRAEAIEIMNRLDKLRGV